MLGAINALAMTHKAIVIDAQFLVEAGQFMGAHTIFIYMTYHWAILSLSHAGYDCAMLYPKVTHDAYEDLTRQSGLCGVARLKQPQCVLA